MSENQQIEADLRQASEALQDLRSKYDGALTKINEANEACKNELESQKTQALEAINASKAAQGEKITALESKMEELKSRFITDENQILIKVGNNADNGEISSLKEALNLALKYSPSIPSSVSREKNKVVVEIQEGWEWVEAIGLYHMDLSHIILTQKNFDVPIMCDLHKDNMVIENGFLGKMHLINSKITINRLHLKAKALDLKDNTTSWVTSFIIVYENSGIYALDLKLDTSLLTSTAGDMGWGQLNRGAFPVWVGRNSDICVKKYESIDTNTGSVAREHGFSLGENSSAYVNTLKISGNRCYSNAIFINASSSAFITNITISGNSGHNGVLISASSSAYIGNITISGNSGHNGVFISASSSACIHAITISGRSGHQHLLVDGSRLINHGSCNFTGGTSGNNQKLAIVRGGLATVAGAGYSRGAGNDANQAVGIWSEHGSWCFYGNRT
ncbi:hypothetical protein CUPS3785_08980 [Campylobacter upsaliensis]|uniref:hypothetical protein n=1 Tax=Campylobacter upsaliensis TaxID=28080 RepID=UPI00214A2E24|nr:hypothetical protein [Campylobacter upsaliensis]MCR2123198.1 hypothetical protein [Campylobacter upsaliensis]